MKGKSTDTELSERERLMLQSFLDGELPAHERALVEGRITSGDPAVAKELEALREVRRYVRTWYQQEVVEVIKDRPNTVWSRIESQIQAEAASARKRSANPLFDVQKMFELFRRPQAIGGLAAAFALGLLFLARDTQFHGQLGGQMEGVMKTAANMRGESAPDGSSRSIARSAPLALSEAEFAAESQDESAAGSSPQTPFFVAGNTIDEDLLTKVGIGSVDQGADYSLSGPLASAPMSSRPLSNTLASRLLNSPQLIIPNDIPGGLRTGGADIDWIKTAKPFKFVPSKDHSNPPVVWIARASNRHP